MINLRGTIQETLALVYENMAMLQKVRRLLDIKATITEWIKRSWKICLNLCSRRLLKHILSLVKNFNPRRLWSPNIDLRDDLFSLGTVFLKPQNEVELRILISVLFHSHIKFGQILKGNCPSFQRGSTQSGTCLDISCRLRYNRKEIWRWSIYQ